MLGTKPHVPNLQGLIVWKLDRLGRSLHDLIGFLDDLKERKIQFQSLTECIDTKTPTGWAMW
jgi:DNA invertase Pin-like site-specific DNA recombinase